MNRSLSQKRRANLARRQRSRNGDSWTIASARNQSQFPSFSIGDSSMATFITTIKFTQQGIKGIDETTKRAAALKSAGKKLGVKVTDIYWTLGDHDGVLVFE